MNFESAFLSLSDLIKRAMAWFSNSTSAMDLHTAVICAGVFVISALVVYLISVFGMRERTYEEAIEEQRRRNQEAIQQAKTDKNKKEKKFKKWGKKSKEKSEEEKGTNCDVEKLSEENESKSELTSNSINTASDIKTSTKKKARQRKSALQEKGEELSQHQSSSEETDDLTSASNSVSSNILINDEEKKIIQLEKLEKSMRSKEDFKNQNSESSLDLPDEKIEELDSIKMTKKSPVKKRKNKGDYSEQSHNIENIEWSEAKLINVIKMSTLTEDEVQHLIDTLNSRIKGNSVDRKKSEIASLKKIIQEKEEALRSEQKLCNAASEQINDLIQEVTEKKAQATATEKSLRDALNQEQQEIKALHGMMQRKREQYASELGAMQSKMQQMKNKMKEEHSLALQRLQEENNQLQSLNRIESEKQQRSNMEITRLQHEIEQLRSSREKFETHQAAMQQSQEDLHKHIEQLMSSHQEEEYSYKQRINEMSNKIQQAENARSSLVQELQNAQSVCSSVEADNSSLRQRLEEAKHQLSNSEQEIMKLQSRLEETNRQQRDMANCLEKMREEVVDLSNAKHEHLQLIQTLKQENESLASQISQNMERMSADGAEQQQNGETTEKSRLINLEEHDSIIQEKEAVANQLLQELEHSKKEIMLLSKDLDFQKRTNEEIIVEKNKVSESLSAAEKKMKEIVQSAELKVKEAQLKVESCSKEFKSMKDEAETIKKEADERILKAENQANLQLEEFQESLYERLNKINLESEAKIKEAVQEKEHVKRELENFAVCIKEFLYRIFPDINVPQMTDNKLCISEYEKEIISHLEKLKKNVQHDSKDLIKKLEDSASEKLNLESEIQNYAIVLAETESILKALQNNIESEESKWKKELQSKDESLKEVRDENEKLKSQNKTLHTNLEQLQGLKEALYEIEELRLKLQKEELEKRLLQEKLGVLDSLSNSSNISAPEHTLAQIPEVNGASGKK